MSTTALKASTTGEAPLGKSLTDLIGNTPLLRLSRVCPSGNLYAKAEWYNPGQSAKDRPAWQIIQDAERQGKLTPGKRLLDATSGNTGIAYAMIGAARGWPVTLCMPASVSPARVKILKAYGAELILTDPALFSDGAILKARELFAEAPDTYFYADQYSNDANWKSHFTGTGPEIWEQTAGKVTHFIATLGTSGTFTGVTRYLRSRNPAIRCIEIQPEGAFHGLEGMKHMESSIQPRIYDPALADESLSVRTEDAYRGVQELARIEGQLVGISSGAALHAARAIAQEHPEAVVVTVFPDNGLKYLSERFWSDTV